jgi:drug/metabolite transporter (DMT)-like permease
MVSKNKSHQSRYLPYLAGIGIAVVFGLSFMFTKDALNLYKPLELLSYRFAIAALVLSLLVVAGVAKVDFRGKPWKYLLILSIFQPILYFIGETLGVGLTSSSEAGMMIALIPVVVTILAVVFLGERPNGLQYASIFISVAGVIFILVLSGGFKIGGHFLGLLFLLGAVVSGGVYNILSKKYSSHFTPVEITFVMMWVGALAFGSAYMIQRAITHDAGTAASTIFTLAGAVPLIYLGVLSSIGAFFMFNYMLLKLPASNAAVFTNLVTVIAILAGVIVKHEAFYWYQMVGGLMIVGGVWGTNQFAAKKISNPEDIPVA